MLRLGSRPLGSRLAASLGSRPLGSRLAARRLASDFAAERKHIEHHARATSGLWRKISYACVPVLLLAGANAYRLYNDHWEHWGHLPPLEERVEYPYQNIRAKRYPWGDGDRTLFWNSEVNYHNHDKVK